MDSKMTGIVSYLTPAGWLVAFLIGDKDKAKFHMNQSLVLFITAIALIIVKKVLGWIIGWIPLLGGLVNTIIGLVVAAFLIACLVLGLIHASREEEKELPVIGGIRILK